MPLEGNTERLVFGMKTGKSDLVQGEMNGQTFVKLANKLVGSVRVSSNSHSLLKYTVLLQSICKYNYLCLLRQHKCHFFTFFYTASSRPE